MLASFQIQTENVTYSSPSHTPMFVWQWHGWPVCWENLPSLSALRDARLFFWPPCWNMSLQRSKTWIGGKSFLPGIIPHCQQPYKNRSLLIQPRVNVCRKNTESAGLQWKEKLPHTTKQLVLSSDYGDHAHKTKPQPLSPALRAPQEDSVLGPVWRWVSSMEYVLTVPVPTTTPLHCSSSDAFLRLLLKGFVSPVSLAPFFSAELIHV